MYDSYLRKTKQSVTILVGAQQKPYMDKALIRSKIPHIKQLFTQKISSVLDLFTHFK